MKIYWITSHILEETEPYWKVGRHSFCQWLPNAIMAQLNFEDGHSLLFNSQKLEKRTLQPVLDSVSSVRCIQFKEYLKRINQFRPRGRRMKTFYQQWRQFNSKTLKTLRRSLFDTMQHTVITRFSKTSTFRWYVIFPRYQGSWGQHGAHLGPVGPRWTPCWSHEPCYLGCCRYKCD